ncbi:MAG: hypothetical protein ABW166_21195, partial [Sedimenticola sp.]
LGVLPGVAITHKIDLRGSWPAQRIMCVSAVILLVFLIAYQFAQLALIDLTPQMTQQVQGGDGWRELLNRSNQNRCYT